MDEALAFGHSCAGHILQGHVIQEEMGQLAHGHNLLPEVSHWVVAQIQTGHFWQSGTLEWEIRSKATSTERLTNTAKVRVVY